MHTRTMYTPYSKHDILYGMKFVSVQIKENASPLFCIQARSNYKMDGRASQPPTLPLPRH